MARLKTAGPAQAGRIALCTALIASGSALAAGYPPEVPDEKALGAYKTYWQAFEEHESRIMKDGERRFNRAWEDVKSQWHKGMLEVTAEQAKALQAAAEKYRAQLAEHPDAGNRPFVMLDLAQVLNTLGDSQIRSGESDGGGVKSEALAVLNEIDREHKAFVYREQALYLRAIILESLDREDDAFQAWKALAAEARTTLYGVHARIAYGDQLFKRENAVESMQTYQKALELLDAITVDNKAYERARINYRLAWAAYRATELTTAVRAASELLSPGDVIRSADQRSRMRQDAVDLIGDALYEANVSTQTREILGRKDLKEHAAAIGLRTMTRYHANGVHAEAGALGDMLIQEHALAGEMPAIMVVTADAWGKAGKAERRIAVLERLAMLLPEKSLWRTRHPDNPALIKEMETKASQAAANVANHYYDSGLASGNNKSFTTAVSYYEMLLAFAPNAPEASERRLRRANCNYFAGNFAEASEQYRELKSRYKVDEATLQVAAYQLVLSEERQWRELFGKAADKGRDPLKDTDTKDALTGLEKAVDEFAARFPGQSRSVDLLLVAASANRDMEKFDAASRYWQRVLVSQGSPAQRGLAIRGLVFSRLRTGSPGEVAETARRFLKLENWAALGGGLANEMRGVLSAATLDEGRRLNGSGQVLQAGQLMATVAEEFPDLPDRDRIWRDGAYMLAIAGDWGKAEASASAYFKAGMIRSRADMTYLLARAHEYQLRLHDAAAKYLELGEKYPRHVRTRSSLQRAEKLALAEGDFALAGQAALVQAEQASRKQDQMGHYARAIEHLDRTDNSDKALATARKRLRASDSAGERFRSRIMTARMTYKTGSEQEGLDELAIIAKDLERQKGRLQPGEYGELAGETNFLLGEEARRKFEDYAIADRGGDAVATKMRIFEDMTLSYDRAAAAGNPKWASQARFQLGMAAEAFGDEVAGLATSGKTSPSYQTRNRVDATVGRLKALAKKYHSTNVLNARRDPSAYKSNEWVKKSSLRLAGAGSDLPEAKHREVIPTATQDDLPSEWSL